LNNNIRKIFDTLGVEPKEEFAIKYSQRIFTIDEELNVYEKDHEKVLDRGEKSCVTIVDFLRGDFEIIKLPILTESDKIAVSYLKMGGMKYLARDQNGLLFAYKNKPDKLLKGFAALGECYKLFKFLFTFVKWSDDEPFCIDKLDV
jgi:hypothetical protein